MLAAQRHYRFRVLMTLAIAFTHANLAFLGLVGRLTYSIPSRYELLREVVGSPLWIWLNALAALLIVASLLTRRWQVTALAFSAGVMGAWSGLTLLWGLSTNPPVSLVAPILGGAVTTLGYLLCGSWARTETRR